MGFESNTGLGVANFYGPRTTLEGLGGDLKLDGAVQQKVLEFSGKNLTEGAPLLTTVIPQNALVTNVYADVEEAFDLGGTTPSIAIGTTGTATTNGVVIDEATAEAKGITDITSTKQGTWLASFAVDTEVSVLLDGTTPTATDDGRLKVVIEYIHVTRS
jgi:ethanolamine utilization microcompartment shell protein EutL